MTVVPPPLVLRYSELEDEVLAIELLAQDFLTPEGSAVLRQFRGDVESAAASGSRADQVLRIPRERPISTIGSTTYSDLAPGGSIWAELSLKWEISPIGRNARDRCFAISGIASTVTRLLRQSNGEREEFAMWRMEIATMDGPGAHFHIQIRGEEDVNPFPHWAHIPRLPGILATPALCLEYALGEVFQRSWERHISSRGLAFSDKWRQLQTRRLVAYLDWQREAVVSAATSPLTALKVAKPDPRRFC